MSRLKMDRGYTEIGNPYADLYDSGEEVVDPMVEGGELPEDYGDAIVDPNVVEEVNKSGSASVSAFGQKYLDDNFNQMMANNPYSPQNYTVPQYDFKDRSASTFPVQYDNPYALSNQSNLLGESGYGEYTGMNWNTVYNNSENNQANTEVINPSNNYTPPEQTNTFENESWDYTPPVQDNLLDESGYGGFDSSAQDNTFTNDTWNYVPPEQTNLLDESGYAGFNSTIQDNTYTNDSWPTYKYNPGGKFNNQGVWVPDNQMETESIEEDPVFELEPWEQFDIPYSEGGGVENV